MTQRESDERRKLTRRTFIQYSAAASGAAMGAYAMTLRTDAVAQSPPPSAGFEDDDGTMTYPYR